jgi:hypothetical protein
LEGFDSKCIFRSEVDERLGLSLDWLLRPMTEQEDSIKISAVSLDSSIWTTKCTIRRVAVRHRQTI